MNNPTETMGDIIATLERDLKSALEEIDRQSFSRHGLEQENAALRAKLADYEECWRACMDDNTTEQHCTCVPALKIRVQKLTAMLKRLEWQHEAEMGAKFCFECSGMWPEHARNCALAALLKGADDDPHN